MRKGRWGRILSVLIGMTMIIAMLNIFPDTAEKLNAASVSEGAKLVDYNAQTGRLIVSIQGKNGNPNGTYSFIISGTGIKEISARLQMAAAKPGDGPGAPGEGPGGGPGGPGGGPAGPGEGPGGGPAGPGADPAGPGKDDTKKQEETQVTTVTNTPAPVPTSTPVSTATPIPTPSATPTATVTPVPKETAAPAATSAETTAKTETTAASDTGPSETTLPETSKETIPEVQDSSSTVETITAAPGLVDPETGNTDPSGDVSGEEMQSEPSVTAADPAEKTTGKSYLWIFILLLLLVIIYLRYRHLSKKGLSFPEIMKNFIPVGALISRLNPSKKEDNYKLDGPLPEVMNGYLQKPTVGVAAARAVRPVRSNTTSATSQRQKPSANPSPRTTEIDPELHEIELRQRELEQKMKEISSQKEKLPGIGDK